MPDLKTLGRGVAQAFRLMVGVQDYERYVAHMAEKHPELTPLSREAFFRACQEARYPGKHGKISKCPC